jgi:hypothetical protein
LGTTVEREARADEVAIGSGLKRVEDIEGKVGLLPSGLDGDGEWQQSVLNGEQRRQWCRVERYNGGVDTEEAKRGCLSRPHASFIGSENCGR